METKANTKTRDCYDLALNRGIEIDESILLSICAEEAVESRREGAPSSNLLILSSNTLGLFLSLEETSCTASCIKETIAAVKETSYLDLTAADSVVDKGTSSSAIADVYRGNNYDDDDDDDDIKARKKLSFYDDQCGNENGERYLLQLLFPETLPIAYKETFSVPSCSSINTEDTTSTNTTTNIITTTTTTTTTTCMSSTVPDIDESSNSNSNSNSDESGRDSGRLFPDEKPFLARKCLDLFADEQCDEPILVNASENTFTGSSTTTNTNTSSINCGEIKSKDNAANQPLNQQEIFSVLQPPKSSVLIVDPGSTCSLNIAIKREDCLKELKYINVQKSSGFSPKRLADRKNYCLSIRSPTGSPWQQSSGERIDYWTNNSSIVGELNVESKDQDTSSAIEIGYLLDQKCAQLEKALIDLKAINATKDALATENAKLLCENRSLKFEIDKFAQSSSKCDQERENLSVENNLLKSDLVWEKDQYSVITEDISKKCSVIDQYEKVMAKNEDDSIKNALFVEKLQIQLECSSMRCEDSLILVSHINIIDHLNSEILKIQEKSSSNLDSLNYFIVTVQGERNFWENRAKSISKDLSKSLNQDDSYGKIKKELLEMTAKLEQALFERKAFKEAMVAAIEGIEIKKISKFQTTIATKSSRAKDKDRPKTFSNSSCESQINTTSDDDLTATSTHNDKVQEISKNRPIASKSSTKIRQTGGCFIGSP